MRLVDVSEMIAKLELDFTVEDLPAHVFRTALVHEHFLFGDTLHRFVIARQLMYERIDVKSEMEKG